MQPFTEGNNFSGALLVADSVGVRASRAYGMADRSRRIANTPETRHHLASLSKAVTATAIMLLEEDGHLSTDNPLSTFMPDFPNGNDIRLHHLLTHTSGIPDINRFPEYGELSIRPQTARTLLPVIASHSADAHGSDSYAYSNSNYNLLAYVIEQASGESYSAFVENRIFHSLNMPATAHSGSARDRALPAPAMGYVPAGIDGVSDAPPLDWSVKTGNGSIVSTVADLRTFLAAVNEGGLLRETSRRKMFGRYAGGNIGYGWFIREVGGHEVRYMNGNTPGVSAYMAYDPAMRLTVVVLANNDVPLATDIGRSVAAMAQGEPYEPPTAFTPRTIGADPAEFVGTYAFSWYSVPVTLADGALVTTMGWPQYPLTLVPTGPDRFLLRYYWDELVFERDDRGSVTGVHWASAPDTKARRAP